MKSYEQLMKMCEEHGELSTDMYCPMCGNLLFEIGFNVDNEHTHGVCTRCRTIAYVKM